MNNKKKVVFTTLFLLLLWLPYMVMCFPGNIAYDAGTGIAWFMNLDRTNPNNPYFQNVLMGLFHLLGADWNKHLLGVALYCVLQSVLMALLLAKITVFIFQNCGEKKRAFLPLILYALVPAFPLYAFCMIKDSSFAVAILFYEYLAMQMLVQQEQFWEKRGNRVSVALSIVLIGLLRNHAGYVPALTLLIYALKEKHKCAVRISCITLFLVCFFSLGLPDLLGLPPVEAKEGMSVPIQTTAYYIQTNPEELTPEEYEAVSNVLPYEKWKTLYQKDTADPLKQEAVLNESTIRPFLRAWFGFWARHPGTMLSGWYRGTTGYLLPWLQTEVKDHAVVGNRMNINILRALHLNQWGNALEENARIVDDFFMDIPVINLFGKIGLYSWGLIALTIITLVQKKGKFFLCLMPLVMVFAGCLFSPVNGYYRYAFPYILNLPVIVSFYLLGYGKGFFQKRNQKT